MKEFCLFGCGEHARVVVDTASSAGWSFRGCWGQDQGQQLPLIDTTDPLPGELAALFVDCYLHVGFLGQPGDFRRRRLLTSWASAPVQWATIIHPSAVIAASATVGAGVYIGPGAVVNTCAQIADHAVINTSVVVEHHAVVGRGVHLAPGVVIGGGVHIGDWASIGMGALIRDHMSVGAEAIVGMGAVVVRGVKPATMVLGSPARERQPQEHSP